MSQSLSNQRSGLWWRRRQLRLMCVVWGDNFEFDTMNANLPCETTSWSTGVMAVDASNYDFR
jgi:hypothetical protein